MSAEYRVPTVRTTPTMVEFARALLKAWPEATKAGAGVMWAQFALETAKGVHCYGNNLGNVKDRDGDGLNYHVLGGVWEIVNGQKVFLSKDDPGSRFVSFASLDEGMRHHLTFIRRKGFRYESAWPFVVAGDYQSYARELGRKGYYTANPDDYVKYGLPHHAEWMRTSAYEEAQVSLEPLPGALYTAMVTAPSGLRLRAAASTAAAVIRQLPPRGIVQVLEEHGAWNEVAYQGLHGFASAEWLARTDAPLTTTEDGLVEVTCSGNKWLVYPVQLGPVGIGEADELVNGMGFELPTKELVDAIYAVADLKIDGGKIRDVAAGHDGSFEQMNSPARYAAVAAEIGRQVGNRSLSRDFFLMAGAMKDVVRVGSGLGLYGWQDASGTPIQGLYTGHWPGHRDYSQGCRPVRRA